MVYLQGVLGSGVIEEKILRVGGSKKLCILPPTFSLHLSKLRTRCCEKNILNQLFILRRNRQVKKKSYDFFLYPPGYSPKKCVLNTLLHAGTVIKKLKNHNLEGNAASFRLNEIRLTCSPTKGIK